MYIKQEEETGFVTGLADYIHTVAPTAQDLGASEYDDYYRSPWATTRQAEERHRVISSELGKSLKGKVLRECQQKFNENV